MNPQCPKCQTKMDPGFIVGLPFGNPPVQTLWIPGEPKKQRFMDFNATQVETGVKVTTFCCPACGYLESYIPVPKKA